MNARNADCELFPIAINCINFVFQVVSIVHVIILQEKVCAVPVDAINVCYTLQGVIEFSLCLFFAKLVSYTFLFWLPKYISIKCKSSASSSTLLLAKF